jgi:hypothetical protein
MGVVIALLAATLVAVAATSAQTGPRSQVRLVEFSPAVVRGTGFQPQERVLVTVRTESTAMRMRVTSSASGAFTARFGRDLRGAICSGFAITATGARGDRAVWKSVPRVCGTPLAP